MNNSNHLKILAVILALLGVGITAYQIFALKTPLTETEHVSLWTVDTRITFDVRGEARPVELRFYLPPVSGAYQLSNELFIANGYGQSLFDDGQNRLVVWTARKVSGPQTLFYRMNLAKASVPPPDVPGETWRAPMPVDEVDKVAVDTLLDEIRQKSADTISFITTAVQTVHEPHNPNVKLLLGPDETPLRRMQVLELLLSQAHIPIQAAHTLRLTAGKQEPELWMRSYIDSTRHSDADWYYFNQATYTKGLPPERLLWWTGDESLIRASGARAQADFRLDRNELTARSLEEVTGSGNFSLYSLPLSTQYAYRLMLMIPFGVFIILILRNIVGLETLGTFAPVLIALAFRETGLAFGLVFFTLIVSTGLLLRAYLEQLKLQMLPRLSVVLSFVILLIIAASLLCYKLGFDAGLSITLFPMVILTMVIERVSVTWEERGGYHAFRVSLGTMAAAAVVYVALNIQSLAYLVFTFPAILLVLVSVMLGIGRYRGYRLTELARFKDLIRRG